MSKTAKIIIYAVLGIVAIALLGMGLYKVAAAVAAVLGLSGGRDALRAVVKASADQAERDAQIQQSTEVDIDRIEMDRKADLAKLEIQRRQAAEARDAAAAQWGQQSTQRIDRATTREELDKALEPDYERLENLLPPERGDRGFVRAGFCATLIIITLIGMAIMGSPARGAPATPADKARAKKRAAILQRAAKEIKRLRDRLEFVTRHYEVQIRQNKRRHERKLEKERQLRQSAAKACAAKLLAASSRQCPPVWPHVLLEIGALGLGGLAGYGICRATTPKATP